MGRRITKIVSKSGNLDGTYQFYYDGQRVVEAYLDSETSPIKEYIWGLQYIDELVQTDVDGTDYYALTDTKYCVLGLVDSSGGYVERYEYTPDGRRQVYFTAGSNDPDARTPTSIAPRQAGRPGTNDGWPGTSEASPRNELCWIDSRSFVPGGRYAPPRPPAAPTA